jgi:hypothetical protein
LAFDAVAHAQDRNPLFKKDVPLEVIRKNMSNEYILVNGVDSASSWEAASLRAF